MSRSVEILAPASSLEALQEEIYAGADAVYVGGMRFGARAYANNLTISQLKEAIDFVHLYGKKLYVTVNTLLNDSELEEELYDDIAPLYEHGLDAAIVQDVGVMSYLHKAFPQLPLHASTQMNLLSSESANQFIDLGIKRFVAARELSINQIRNCCDRTSLEVEVFVQGALCYCYSGQCLMSSIIGGRSGNRGMCAGTCRLPFDINGKTGYFLSPKDVCTLGNIPDLVDAGIDSFKIEGRMKSKEYGVLMTHLYGKYVDFYLNEGRVEFNKEIMKKEGAFHKDVLRAMDIYNRGGFCQGYLFEKDNNNILYTKKNNHFGVKVGTVTAIKNNHATIKIENEIQYQDVLEFRNEDGTNEYEYTVKDSVASGGIGYTNVLHGSHIYVGQEVYRTRNHALLKEIDEFPKKKIELSGVLKAKKGQKCELTVWNGDASVCVMGKIVQGAKNKPLEEKEIRKHLLRTGETLYIFKNIELKMEENIFIPLSSINQLRRDAIETFEENVLSVKRRKAGVRPVSLNGERTQNNQTNEIMVSVCTKEQLEEAVLHKAVTIVHCKLEYFEETIWSEIFAEIISAKKIPAYSLPRVLTNAEFSDDFLRNKESYPMIALVNSWEMWDLLKKWKRNDTIFTDSNLYVSNQRSVEVYKKKGATGFIAPLDSKSDERFDYEKWGAFLTVYGKIPVMITKGCIGKFHRGEENQRIPMISPKGDAFVAIQHCKYCYNTIITKNAYQDNNVYQKMRFDFIDEDRNTIKEVLSQWKI